MTIIRQCSLGVLTAHMTQPHRQVGSHGTCQPLEGPKTTMENWTAFGLVHTGAVREKPVALPAHAPEQGEPTMRKG